jgi:hypothetical protein
MAVSAAQLVPVVALFDYYLSGQAAGSGNSIAKANIQVKVQLNVQNATSITPLTNLGNAVASTTTDANGFWQLWLVPNTNISPANTLYIVQIDGQTSYRVTLAGVGPYQSTASGVIFLT